MGTQLATIEPISPPDVRRPAKLTILPQWVVERLGTLKREEQPGPDGIHREVPTLPVLLDQDQKQILARHCEALAELDHMTPENDDAHGKATLIAISKMTMTLAGREAGELAGAAKGEAYMAALDDVAFWAVEEVARRWYRGGYGSGRDYRWMPDPATMRELAQLEEFRVKGVRRQLRELIDAKLPRFSDEHRASMLDRLESAGIKVA